MTCSNSTCVGGVCTGSCATGQKQCSGQQPQNCSPSGSWQNNGASCDASGTTCVAGVCSGVCAVGSVGCSNSNEPETCSNTGTWTVGSACSNKTCVSGVCTGSCAPGQTQCSGPLAVQSCNATGGWQTTSTCEVSCSKGACTAPMCKTGAGTTSTQCAAGQDCCFNAAASKETCGTCTGGVDGGAGSTILDCTGSTGNDECPTGTVCCATAVLGGLIVTAGGYACTMDSMTSSCQTSCADNPPLVCGTTGSPATSTVRLCTSASDCASDTGNPYCCSYGATGLSTTISWCASTRAIGTCK